MFKFKSKKNYQICINYESTCVFVFQCIQKRQKMYI